LQTAIFVPTIEKGVVVNVLEEGGGKSRKEGEGKGRREGWKRGRIFVEHFVLRVPQRETVFLSHSETRQSAMPASDGI